MGASSREAGDFDRDATFAARGFLQVLEFWVGCATHFHDPSMKYEVAAVL